MLKQGFMEKWSYGNPVLNLFISIDYNKEFRNRFNEIQTKENQFWENLFKDIEKCREITNLIVGEKYVTNRGYLFPGNFSELGDRLIANLDVEKNFKELIRLNSFINEGIYYNEKPMVELDVTNYRGEVHITLVKSKLWTPEFSNF